MKDRPMKLRTFDKMVRSQIRCTNDRH